MEFIVNSNVVKDCLSIISNICDFKSTTSDLIKIRSFDNELEFSCINRKQGVAIETKTKECKIESDGEMVIKASLIVPLFRELSNKEVEFKSTIKLLTIKSDTGQYKFSLDPVSSFSKIDFVQESDIIELDSTDLFELIHETFFCLPTQNDLNPILNHALLKIDDNSLEMVCTDSKYISIFKNNLNLKAEKSQYLLSKPFLDVCKKLIRSKDCKCDILFGSNKILIKTDDMNIFSSIKTEVNEFPDYQKIINFNNKLIVDTNSLLKTIKTVSLFTDENYRAINLNIKKDKLEIRTTDKSLVESIETIGCSWKKDPKTITINSMNFIKILDKIESTNTIIDLDDNPKKPILIYPETQKENRYNLYCTVPILI